MKKIYLFTILCMGILAFSSCEDDATPVLSVKSPAKLEQLAQSEYRFTADNATEMFTVRWKPADFGFAAVADYTVRMTNKDNGKTLNLGVTKSNELSLSYKDINAFLGQMNVYPGQTGNMSISLSCSAYDSKLNENFAEAIDFKVVPYDPKAVEWNYVYVAVGYPDWDWTKAYMLGDPDENGDYEGYVDFPEDNATFAILDGKTLQPIVEGQQIANKGFYHLLLSGGELKPVGAAQQWALIGDATSGGWGSDTSLDYDAETRLWTKVVKLTAGKEFKFRANSDWGINLGAASEGPKEVAVDQTESLEANGPNFKMKADKDIAYLVTLNLTEAGKYTFFLTETSFVPSSEFITMPGSYQGWNPGGEDCYKLTSPDRNYVYSGTHYMPEGTLFKFHDAGSWIGINGKIAWNAENNGGTFAISINGGENIEMTHGGYYKFIVNTEKKTCKFMQSGWGVVGDATPGDWSKDTWMTYDPETKLWTVTMDMKNGHFKFRWDADWAINFGGDLGALTQGGDNIPITAGNYTITLNPEAKSATVTKN